MCKVIDFDENVPNAFYDWFELNPKKFDKEDLKRAYRKLARQYHPDKNEDKDAQEKFVKIGTAFDVLNDDKKRAHYDAHGGKVVNDGGGAGGYAHHADFAHDIFRRMFDDMFDMDDFFGGGFGGAGGKRGRGRGPSSQTELEVSLEDLYMGRTMHLEYSRTKLCSHCHGSGANDPKDAKTCPKCKGAGAYIAIKQLMPGIVQQIRQTCEECQGRGVTVTKVCRKCNGERIKRHQERIEVVIPAGTKDGEVFRFKGMADEDPDREAGDLIVALRTREHALFQRDGMNLYATVQLSLKQALLGFQLDLPQLDGSPLELTRNDTTQNDFVDRIIGAGMPIKGSEKRGDLFVKYRVILPPKLSTDQRLFIEKALGSSTNPKHQDEL